ncbi:nyctalopin-like isoform X2 [Toxorhynchites rutilus septentrionalis]|nr:nyctalopin-like isoform X2 [Toxorhynchites rutilus septentrionalis]XP_055625570.1 nyctalopin-like isoform X2 [Toxorhynchites rutilus septentrionalis]XP_055625571.1 nyctalopin-like isoform X2 [Toxorhynchites rutilus septentrionalis]XP_055625572.1 nyctalopin-like isoform X2 [Toxorhynchites rutilus septentrionalis]XP_055625573.1 nyctalopin-like isoform X2 [Toxorhynchites rutilus septentrionalis]
MTAPLTAICPSRRVVAAVLMVLLICIPERIIGFCPSLCTCEADRNLRTSCINASLEVVPIQLNPDVRHINLSSNAITNVHFTLGFYYQLEVLDISHNRLDTLGSRNFEAQEKLRVLDLSSNVLTALLKDSFRGLARLGTLRLNDNRIEKIHPTAFHGLSSLTELDLSDNQIVSFEDDVFKPLPALERLSLENNQILEVPYDSNLEHLRSLRHLELSVNLVEFIANDSFEALRELRTLNLAGNVLTELDLGVFNGLSALQHLDMADNNLTVIPTLQLSKLYNLTSLSLSGNSFVQLPAVSFLNLFHLRELHLNRLDRLERIEARAFVDNTYLQILTLDDNPSFSALPVRLFHGNPHLIDISIRRNALLSLDAVQFPLDRLQRLKLAGNPLVCNCSIRWLWRLVTGTVDEDDSDGVGMMGRSGDNLANITTVLMIDKDEIGCDLNEDGLVTRRILRNMSEGDINCPAHLVTILSVGCSIFIVLLVALVVVFYRRRIHHKKKILQERKNVHERIVPQKVDKLELERYLAQQVLANDYRELRPCDVQTRYDSKCSTQPLHSPDPEESDHYENIDYLQHQRALNHHNHPYHQNQHPHPYHQQPQSAPAMTLQHPNHYSQKYPPLHHPEANNTLPVHPQQRTQQQNHAYSPNFFIYALYSHFIFLLLIL